MVGPPVFLCTYMLDMGSVLETGREDDEVTFYPATRRIMQNLVPERGSLFSRSGSVMSISYCRIRHYCYGQSCSSACGFNVGGEPRIKLAVSPLIRIKAGDRVFPSTYDLIRYISIERSWLAILGEIA